jgi:hypothetical protein
MIELGKFEQGSPLGGAMPHEVSNDPQDSMRAASQICSQMKTSAAEAVGYVGDQFVADT